MWHDHPFSERNKTLKKSELVNVEGGGEEGLDKILKRWAREYSGVFIT